jgi:hypothetical protein
MMYAILLVYSQQSYSKDTARDMWSIPRGYLLDHWTQFTDWAYQPLQRKKKYVQCNAGSVVRDTKELPELNFRRDKIINK